MNTSTSPQPESATVNEEKRFLKQNFSGIYYDQTVSGKRVEFIAVGGMELLGYDAKAVVAYKRNNVERFFEAESNRGPAASWWWEMRVAIFSKRNPDEGVHPDRWTQRKLPRPHVSVALAGIEKRETFRRHWGVRARQLEVENETVSIFADGAHTIWDAALLEFSKRDEVLDVYRERLAAGQSIGSGQVEGACKNLIGKRLKQTARGGGYVG